MENINIIGRIRQIIEYKGISTRKFCIEVGIANGFLDKVKDVGCEKAVKILDTYPEISMEWLLTGNGQMLKNQVLKSEKEGGGLVTQQMIDKITEQAEEIARLKIEIEEYKKTISSLKDRIEVVPDAKCAIAG